MKRLLLVGWDGADWKVIHPLLDDGKMPNLARLVENGVIGNLATLYPELSPMLWTSIATGKRPFKHGIHGFYEPSAQGGVQPITNLSRTTRALWNILTLPGLRSNVVGWWPSHPAEPIDGVMVSDLYSKAVDEKGKPWPMVPGTVHPAGLEAKLADLRCHPADLDPGLMMLFLPRLGEIDQDRDRRVTQIARTIAECFTVCNAAQALMRFEPWTLTAVYFDSIDHFSHGFMNYRPPRLDWVAERDFELYQEVVESGYRLHDILLGRLLDECDEETVVVVISDHGFHSDHLRPRNLPDEPAGPAEQHRHFGIFVASGPGIRKDERLYGANLLDITPTVLACLDLPVGEDMDGRVLTGIFEQEPQIEQVPSWDDVTGNDGRHPADQVIDPQQAERALRQLVELGYIEPLPPNRKDAVDQCRRELEYNLARAYMDAGLHIEAVPLLEALLGRWPGEFRFGIQLINCLIALDRADQAGELLEQVLERKSADVLAARDELREFREKHEEQLARLYAGEQDALSDEDRWRLRRLYRRAGLNRAAVSYFRGVVALARRDFAPAVEHLSRASQAQPQDVRILLKLAEGLGGLGRTVEAEAVCRKALDLDPENAPGWLALGKLLAFRRSRKDQAKAIEALNRAIGLLYFSPLAHYFMGICLQRQGNWEAAAESFARAAGQNPNFPEAHLRLAGLLQRRLGLPDEACQSRRKAREARRRLRLLRQEQGRGASSAPPIPSPGMPASPPAKFPYVSGETVVVVSGLPRSGTSLMMQMLAAGGLEVLTDGIREADDCNQAGYFEYEKVKSLGKDVSWVGEARGKAVKIIAHLLGHLPGTFKYKVLFMWRPMVEVLASQEAMLARAGLEGARDQVGLAEVFTRQLHNVVNRLGVSEYFDVLFVAFDRVLSEPSVVAREINAFLSGTLREEAMSQAVRPELRRHVGA